MRRTANRVALPIALAATLSATSILPTAACNSEMLSVLDWEVVKNDSSLLPYRLIAQVEYRGQRGFRMIHAGVIFSDVLGQGVGQVNLNRDSTAQPGDNITADGQVEVDARMATLNPEDIVLRTCVWSIVYDDGTKEEF